MSHSPKNEQIMNQNNFTLGLDLVSESIINIEEEKISKSDNCNCRCHKIMCTFVKVNEIEIETNRFFGQQMKRK